MDEEVPAVERIEDIQAKNIKKRDAVSDARVSAHHAV